MHSPCCGESGAKAAPRIQHVQVMGAGKAGPKQTEKLHLDHFNRSHPGLPGMTGLRVLKNSGRRLVCHGETPGHSLRPATRPIPFKRRALAAHAHSSCWMFNLQGTPRAPPERGPRARSRHLPEISYWAEAKPLLYNSSPDVGMSMTPI